MWIIAALFIFATVVFPFIAINLAEWAAQADRERDKIDRI